MLLQTMPMSQAMLNVAAYTVIGLVLFGLAFFLMGKLTPFSLRKEIEEDQNVALGIVMASVIIGIAMIIVAAITG
jgi:putative membrane protein